MGGLLFVPLLFVPVALPFLSNMFYFALKEAYLLYDIMRSKTLPLLCLLRSAPKCVLNLNYSLFTDDFSLTTFNTQEGAHLDIAANGFWGGQLERCFMDVQVFNPLAPSNSSSSLSFTFKKHENIKPPFTK